MAQSLKESLKFGKDSFEDAIEGLIEELEGAQKYLNESGPEKMREVLLSGVICTALPCISF